MAKTLNSITVDAPTGSITPSVNDTFAFTGTPGFSGTGGVNRYDFKWEVDNGGGYVTIASSGTGLITSSTNPVVNSNSQAAQSITVTCDESGSYTIRMVGAPATGGSYTVISATRSVTVSAGAITGTLAVTESADTLSASGDVLVEGTLVATEAADTFSASGDVLVEGTLAATEAADTFEAEGTVGDATVTGTLAVTDGADSFSSSGDVLVEGNLIATEAADVFEAEGSVSTPSITGTLAAVDGADTFSASGDSGNTPGPVPNLSYLRIRFCLGL